MGSNLNYKPLKYFLAEKPRNGLYKGKEFQGAGNRWIKMGEVFSKDFISGEETSERIEVTNSEIERFSCKSGDLLFGRTSLTLEGVGDCLLVQDISDAPIFESNLFRIRFDLTKAYPLFFYYFFKSQFGRQIIQRIAKQTAATSITANDLIEEDVPKFSLKEQIRIANLIHDFDKKKYLNLETNQTLEQMAQALFKSWFVDFDPVIDNALAAGNDIPEALQHKAELRLQAQQLPDFKPLPDDIRALFPSEFEQIDESSIGIAGWIPKGWKVGALKQHAHIKMGQSPKGDTYNSEGLGMPLINGPVEFGDYFTNQSKWTIAPTKVSQEGDLIVCVRGSTTGRYVKSNGVYCLGRGVCSVTGKQSQVFTDLIFKSSINALLGLATGSTFPNWSSQTLNEFKVIMPEKSAIEAFDKFVSINVTKIESNVIESESLKKLRDILLPKLLSGEIVLSEDVA